MVLKQCYDISGYFCDNDILDDMTKYKKINLVQNSFAPVDL